MYNCKTHWQHLLIDVSLPLLQVNVLDKDEAPVNIRLTGEAAAKERSAANTPLGLLLADDPEGQKVTFAVEKVADNSSDSEALDPAVFAVIKNQLVVRKMCFCS